MVAVGCVAWNAQATASLTVKKTKVENTEKSKQNRYHVSSKTTSFALSYEASVRGDEGDEQLILEAYYFGQDVGSKSKAKCVARDRIFVPVCSSSKTVVMLTSPSCEQTESDYRDGGREKKGFRMTGVFCRLLREDQVLKTFKDLRTLNNVKLATYVPEIDADVKFDTESSHEIIADWQGREDADGKKDGKKGGKKAEEKEVKKVAFFGLEFGDKVNGGQFDPGKRFSCFDQYFKYVTPKTGQLYAIKMSRYLDGGTTEAEREAKFKEISGQLEKKYKLAPVVKTKFSADASKLRPCEKPYMVTYAARCAVFELSGMTLRLTMDGSYVALTAECPQFFKVADREIKKLAEEKKKKEADNSGGAEVL